MGRRPAAARAAHALTFAWRCRATAWGELGAMAAAARAGPGDGGAPRAGAGAVAPVLNLNNEVSHPHPRPLGWRSQQAGGGGPGGTSGDSGSWRRPGRGEGSGRGGRPRVAQPAGRNRPDPPHSRRGCLERGERLGAAAVAMWPETIAPPRPGKRCTPWSFAGHSSGPAKVSAACVLDSNDKMLVCSLGRGGAENEKIMT